MQLLLVVQAQGPAIERFIIGIIELQTATPRLALLDAVHNDVDADVLCVGFAIGFFDVADMEVSPEEIRARHRNGDQIASIDGDAGAFCGDGSAFVFLVPFAESDIPQGKRLQGGGFAGIVLPDKDNRLAQFDVRIGETLEISDS